MEPIHDEVKEWLHKAHSDLRSARILTEHDPPVPDVACFHCLAGHKEQAYSWIEKAIKAGYDDADHLTQDDDFKSIRDEERFKKLAKSISG